MPLKAERKRVINVEDFRSGGVLGKAELQASRAAVDAAAAAGGGAEWHWPAATYDLGNLGVSEEVFSFTGRPGIRITTPGSLIVCNTVDANSIPMIFLFNDCENWSAKGFRMRDDGFDSSVTNHGAILFDWANTVLAAGALKGVTLDRCKIIGALAFLRMRGTAGARLQNIELRGHCGAENSYYGILNIENGDYLRGSFYAKNVRRAYFPYGVKGHDIDVYVEGVTGGLSSNACIPINRVDRDTLDMKVRAHFSGDCRLWGRLVKLEQQNDLQNDPVNGNPGGLVDNIDVDVDIADDATIDGSVYPFSIVDEVMTTGLPRAVTNARWNHIRLGGNFSNKAFYQMDFPSKPNTEGILVFKPEVRQQEIWRSHYPGFVIRTAHDREFRTRQGDLTTQPIDIPLGQMEGLGFILRVKTYAQGDYTATAAQNATYYEDTIIGYNAGGGAVVIQSSNRDVNRSQGVAAGVAFAANGENLRINFTGANYNGANAYAKVVVEYVSRGPAN